MGETIKDHICLELNSRKRTRGTIEDFVVALSHQITFNQSPNKSYYLRLENIQIPHSFYQVNSNNNTFQVIETDGVTPHTLTITIDAGNYTISELLTELEAALDTASAASGDTNSYTLTYDDITNKITLKYDGGTSTSVTVDTIANNSTMNVILGLGKADTDNITGGDTTLVLADGVESVAPNSVDLHYYSYIIVETSLSSNNYYDENGQIHIGCRVPIIVDRNIVNYFGNQDGHMTKLNNKGPLSVLEMKLKDEFGNLIDLNEVDWSVELCIYELTKPMITDPAKNRNIVIDRKPFY